MNREARGPLAGCLGTSPGGDQGASLTPNDEKISRGHTEEIEP